MTKLNSAHAPNAEMQLRSAVLSSLVWSDCRFWSEKVPCISVSDFSCTGGCRIYEKIGCLPELAQSSSLISLVAPCTDALPVDEAFALSLPHFDCEEADDRLAPAERTLTLARLLSQAFRFALPGPPSA